MTKARPRSVWTYVTPFSCYLPIFSLRHQMCRAVGQQRSLLTDSQRSGSQRRQADSLVWNFKLIPILAGRETATTRGDFVWLGLWPWAYRPRDCGVAAMHDIPYLFGGEDVKGELDRPSSQCGVAGRILVP